MKRLIVSLLCATTFASTSASFAADVVYGPDNCPDDRASIVVPDGVTVRVLSSDEEPNVNLRYLWDFDNDEMYLTDVLHRESENTLSPVFSKAGGKVVWGGDAPKYGAGAVYVDNAILQVAALPSFMDRTASRPFTVSFWFQPSENSVTNSSEASASGENDAPNLGKRIFYFGKTGTGPVTGEYISMYFNVKTDLKTNPIKFRDAYGEYDLGADYPLSGWTHVAFVVTPIDPAEHSGKNVLLNVYVNGVLKRNRQIGFDAGDDVCLCFGGGYGTSGITYIQETQFDQVMIFDRALNQDEVWYYANQAKPFAFSAGWDIAQTGTLEMPVNSPQRVRGSGMVKAEVDLTVAGGSDIYGGMITGAGLTVSKNAGEKQVLSGHNTYTGVTSVTSGTLLVDPSLTTILPEFEGVLVAYYPFDNADRPGRDVSGNGNDLSPVDMTDVKGGIAWCTGAKAGAMEIDKTGSETNGWKSAGMLNGFSVDEDNSYTIGFWMRMDEVAQYSGSFCFWDGKTITGKKVQGMYVNGADTRLIYAGDSGKLITGTLPKTPSQMYGSWVHIAYVYDKDSTTKKQILYVNGVEQSTHANTPAAQNWNHCTYPLYVGWYHRTEGNVFDGAIDEFFVLKGAYPGDVEKMMNFRSPVSAVSATGVLPAATELSVMEGAKVAFANANETVGGLSGTVEIDEGSKLTIADNGKMGVFTCTGTGTFDLGANLIWDLGMEKVRAGVYAVGTVPGGFMLPKVSSTWRIVNCNQVIEWFVDGNALKAKVLANGICIVVR